MNGHRYSMKMAVRVLQGAQENVAMRSLEKKWIAKLKDDDRLQGMREQTSFHINIETFNQRPFAPILH